MTEPLLEPGRTRPVEALTEPVMVVLPVWVKPPVRASVVPLNVRFDEPAKRPPLLYWTCVVEPPGFVGDELK